MRIDVSRIQQRHTMSDSLRDLLATRARAPQAIVLGSPREAADLAAQVSDGDITCYQMDLYQADRLREELAARNVAARVETLPDLWDLPAHFQSALYPAPRGGERILKIDMVEQAFHILKPRGAFVVLTPYDNDPFFPPALKKV